MSGAAVGSTGIVPAAARSFPSALVRSVLLRLTGAALLLFAIARMFDAGQIWRIISSVTVAGVAVILTLTVLSWIVGIAKWKALLGAVPVSAVGGFYFLGQLYSLVLPGQLAGEAVKTARLAARGPGLGPVAASVLIDRLTSLVGLGVVAGVGLWWAGHRGPMFTALAWLIWLLTGAFTLLLFAMRWSALQRRATRGAALARRRGGRWRKLATVLRRFVHSWAAYGTEAKLVATTLVLAVAFQLANVAIVTSIAASLHVTLAFSDAAWLVGLISIMTLLPISFGGVGVREAGFVGLLSMIGVPGAQALSVSLICSLIVVLAAAVGLLVELHWIKAIQPISGGR